MYRLFIVWIGKLLLVVTRWRGGGSALPGLVVEKLYPNFLQSLRSCFGQTLLVAGTNGKTTTSKMLREMLSANGKSVLHNRAGSNMPRGIISSALEAMDWHGRLYQDYGLFEVDEGFLQSVAENLRPHIIIVLNLHRDQLDRYGELDRILKILSSAIGYADKAVLNRDDPKLLELSGELEDKALWFGAIDSVASSMPADDALHGNVRARSLTVQPEIAVEIQATKQSEIGQHVDLVVKNTTLKVDMQLKGVFNVYNAAAALTAVYALGIDIKVAGNALASVSPAFGRSEIIKLDEGRKVQLLLVKNPSGFNHTIQSYLADDTVNPILILINDNYADGRDVSWLWDVNIEKLSGSKKRFLTGGVRGTDMCLRLGYADISCQHHDDMDKALEDLITGLAPGETGYIVPTYTAMLDIRRRLGKYSDSIGGRQ